MTEPQTYTEERRTTESGVTYVYLKPVAIAKPEHEQEEAA